jgi:hypothetical protein
VEVRVLSTAPSNKRARRALGVVLIGFGFVATAAKDFPAWIDDYLRIPKEI